MISCKNKKVGFIVDTSSCIKPNQYDDVCVVPLCINVNKNNINKSYRDTDEKFKLDFDKIIKQKDNFKITTAQTPISDMIKACKMMSKKYDEIYVFPINRCLSNCINSWKIIKNNFPKINVIQYKDFCLGLNWDIQTIKHIFKTKKIDQNSLNVFFEKKTKNNHLGFAIVNDISWLIKGGRLGSFKGSITKLLGLKPIIFFNHESFIYRTTAKNYKDFIEKIFKYLTKNFYKKKVNKILILSNDSNIENIKEIIYSKWPKTCFETINIPTILSIHTGPNTLGIYFDLE